MKAKPPKKPTYILNNGGESITCMMCGLTSYNVNDVKFLYCGNCHKFHEPPPQKPS